MSSVSASRAVPPPPPPPAPRRRPGVPAVAAGGAAWRPPLITGALVAAGTLYTGIADPNTSHSFPLCPLKVVTGLDCPFCGCLRATHALAHGQLVEAADHNLLFTLAVPFLLVLWVGWTLRSLGFRVTYVRLPRPVRLGLFVLVGAFTVARNLPFTGLHWLNSATA